MTACPHPSASGFTAEDGCATLTCSTCGEVLASDPGTDTYELEVGMMRHKSGFISWRSWTGRRWLNGKPYDGPVYYWLSTRTYDKEVV